MPKSKPPKRIWYKGKRRTFSEIASLEGVTPEAVRKWHSRHGNLADYSNRCDVVSRWGRRVSWKNGEGMNIDTLFLRGRIDIDTYLRYLQEYERQTRHGKGHKAVGTIVDGKLYYKLTDKEDNNYNPLFGRPEDMLPSVEEVEDAVSAILPPAPDYRNAVVREVERGSCLFYVPYEGEFSTPNSNWAVCGHDGTPSLDDGDEQCLDGLITALEDG